MSNQRLKVYLKIHTYLGPNIANSNTYEILDDNTFLDKRKQQQKLALAERLVSFTLVFGPGFQSQIINNAMGVVSNAFNGIDQILVVKGSHALKNSMLIGSTEKSGLIINLFGQILAQSHNSYQVNSKVSISAFSTQGENNSFLDLLIGNRFTFSSKKTFDNFKTFHQKQITDMRQFLICLKIMLTRFQQCCTSKDTFVLKVNVQNYDEFAGEFRNSTFHLIYAQQNVQNFRVLMKRIQSLQSDNVCFGDDHGDMINLLQKQVKSSQIKVLYQIDNSVQSVNKNIETLKFLGQIYSKALKKTSQDTKTKKFKKQTLNEQIKRLFKNIQDKNNMFNHLKNGINNRKNNLNSLSFKQSLKLQKAQQLYAHYLQQNTIKLKNYFELISTDIQERANWFQAVRFPVSLQIKDANLKNFHIAKIYSLSQKYKMPNSLAKYQKLKSIKSQVILSTEALKKHLLTQRTCQSLQKIFEKAALILQTITTFLKALFSLTANNFILDQINPKSFEPQALLHNQLLVKFDYTVKQKQEPHLRIHDFSIRKMKQNKSCILGQSNSFQNFSIYKANRIIGHNIKRTKKEQKQNQQQKKEKRNFTLPQILIIKKNC